MWTLLKLSSAEDFMMKEENVQNQNYLFISEMGNLCWPILHLKLWWGLGAKNEVIYIMEE